MKHSFFTLVAAAFLILQLPAAVAELSDSDKQFLDGYIKVGAALTGDNLENAKQAATEMGEFGAVLAKSENIATARKEYEQLSARAISLGHGREGYYTVNCPMLQKEWLQPAGRIANPYAGGTMPECGKIRKAPQPRANNG
jgi:hypothetical protein